MSVFPRTTSSMASPLTGLENDVEVANPPSDSVSCMQFSPQAELLAVGSWDSKVRIYEVSANGQAQGKALYEHEAPVLSLCWTKAGDNIYSAGADNAARVFNLATSQTTQVALHDAPIKAVQWAETPYMASGMLITGSWDKTIKYWDLRTPTPIATAQLPERCYAMDVVYPLMVVGTAERGIHVFNLSNPSEPFRSMPSPLSFQTRVIKCFPTANGFCLGSIEGRVALQYLEPKNSSSNFSFRCHRKSEKAGPLPAKDQNTVVYAVNDINFHPIYGTFSTCGSDGTISYWDGDSRLRTRVLDPASGPISATCFNRTGAIHAYAVSYDWHKGYTGMTPGHPNRVILHPCKDEDVKKKQRGNG